MKPDLAARLLAWTLAATIAPAPLLAQTPPPAPAEAPTPTPSDPLIVALIEAHNQERAKEKLPPLRYAPLLEEAAKGHARDMADREKMAHEGSDGSTPSQRIVKAGYHYLTSGENVAHGYRDVATVMQGWMDSPPHKKNILGDFTEIGIARVDAKDGHPYWCADFGKPMPKLDPSKAPADVIRGFNRERVAAKLVVLAVDPLLSKTARDQAVEMAKGRGKEAAKEALDKVDGKKYREVGMTSASGQPDADALVKSLLDDPVHKANILGKFTRVGVGYATAEDGTPHWAVILAIPSGR